MNSVVKQLLLSAALVAGSANLNASEQPLLKADYVAVAEGGNVIISVLDNDIVSTGGFNLSSMYISSEATKGYLSIDAAGRISYTHYGGPATVDTFSYVISDNQGTVATPGVVMIRIGDGPLAGTTTNTEPAPTSATGNAAAVPSARRNTSADVVVNRSDISSEGVVVAIPDGLVNKPQRSENSVSTPPVTTGGSTGLSAVHRSGQTFLTWPETGSQDGYHVYRSGAPITAANISSATKLTKRWGALGSDTSANVYGGDHVPDNFVISDLASPLNNNTGLFVYTTQRKDEKHAYYAITSVKAGKENLRLVKTLNTPVTESVATPQDILTVSTNNGKGRIYTQFMDYSRWNPTLNGYAYHYSVALPANYSPTKKYPLYIELHAYQETPKFEPESQYGWQVIQLFPTDPGPAVGSAHSWWFGYAANHDYRVQGSSPSSGRIENYTEQRIMRAIDQVTEKLSVDKNRIHGAGNSMGASGLLSLAIRYGSVITGIYASEPMTNYAGSGVFAEELVQLWGARSRNLPVINRGPHSESISNVRVGVWDWMNHQKQLVARRGTNIGFLMTMHGKQDQVIEWQSQGKPFVQALTNGNVGFTAKYEDVGHTWVGFVSVIESLFGFGYEEHFPYKYPLHLSFPGISNASGSGPLRPTATGVDSYNMSIEWATPHTPFGKGIVDKPTRYEITLRSNSGRQTADITPRRTANFRPASGQQCQYKAVSPRGKALSAGAVMVDRDSLLTVKSVPVLTGTGTRLIISCR